MLSGYWAELLDRPTPEKVVKTHNKFVKFEERVDDKIGGKLHGILILPENPEGEIHGVVGVPGWTSSYRRSMYIGDELASRGYASAFFNYRVDGTAIAKSHTARKSAVTIAEKISRGVMDIIPGWQGSYHEDTLAALQILERKCKEKGVRLSGEYGIVGHSMGGHMAATFKDDDFEIKRRAPINPYHFQLNGEGPQRGSMITVCSGDTVAIPELHGLPLFENSPGPKELNVVQGGCHTYYEDGSGVVVRECAPQAELDAFAVLVADWFDEGFKKEPDVQEAVPRSVDTPIVLNNLAALPVIEEKAIA